MPEAEIATIDFSIKIRLLNLGLGDRITIVGLLALGLKVEGGRDTTVTPAIGSIDSSLLFSK